MKYRRVLLVYWKEILIRMKAFRGFILLLSVVLTVGIISLMIKQSMSPQRAFFESIKLLFLASDLQYPEGDIYLEVLWMIFPILGLMVIGDGLSTMGSLLKYGDRTTEEWNREMAKLMKDHVIIVGIGNVGLKVLKELINEGKEDIVVIDDLDESGREEEFMRIKKEIPLIQKDATKEEVLEEAGVRRAEVLLLLIDDDLVNLKIALQAKELNPNIKVVIRMFDLKFGEQIKQKFEIEEVISTSSISAPFFVKAVNSNRHP